MDDKNYFSNAAILANRRLWRAAFENFVSSHVFNIFSATPFLATLVRPPRQRMLASLSVRDIFAV
jgi:hypothetical protein